jgi:hypothetical protein
MSIQVNLSLKKSKYPVLDKFKVKDRDKIIYQMLDIGYNALYPEFTQDQLDNIQKDSLILESIDKVREDLSKKIDETTIQNQVNDLANIITKLTGISNTSSKKGELTEKLVENMFKTKYPGLTYEATSHVAHSGDGRLHFPENFDVLVELKNYTQTVHTDEVEKFSYDMKFTNLNLGLFISLQTPIRGVSNFDYKQFIHNDTMYHQIYIGCLNQNLDILDAALMMIRQLNKVQKFNFENIDLIRNQIDEYFKELLTLYEKNKKLRQQFYDMENTIKSSLSVYYCQLRENQVDLESKIKDIHNKISSTIDKNDTNSKDPNSLLKSLKDKKYWGFEYVSKFIDKLSKDSNFRGNDDTYYIDTKTKTCEMKLMTQKIIFNIDDPCMTFTLDKKSKSNDKTLKTLVDFFF